MPNVPAIPIYCSVVMLVEYYHAANYFRFSTIFEHYVTEKN